MKLLFQEHLCAIQRQTNEMEAEGCLQNFRYRFLGSNRHALSKTTKWVEDGNGVKVRFTNESSYSPTQLNFDNGGKRSLGDLLRTTKGKCLFHADAGHGQVCGPLCNTRMFHAEKDHHKSLDLRETKDMGIGVFTKQSIPIGTVLGLYHGIVRPYEQLTAAQKRYSNFLFKHPQHGELYVDASVSGNWTRFLNHSCDPNCAFARALRCGYMRVIYVRTRRFIRAGEQLFVDYGRDYFDSIDCKCGSKGCRSVNSGSKRKRDDEFEYERLFSDEFRETMRAGKPRRDGLRSRVKVRKLR